TGEPHAVLTDRPKAAPTAIAATCPPVEAWLSTARDYMRFCTMLANLGELGGVRIIGPRALRLMTMNHLPCAADLALTGQPTRTGATTLLHTPASPWRSAPRPTRPTPSSPKARSTIGSMPK